MMFPLRIVLLFILLGSLCPPAIGDDAAFQATADRYWKILSRRPRRGTAFDLLYRHYLDAGRIDDWKEEIKRRAADAPQDSAAQILLGLAHEQQSQLAEAAAAYKEARRLTPEDYYSAWLAGELAARTLDIEEAAAALKKAMSLRPPRADLLEIGKRLGGLQARQGRADEAMKTWGELAAAFPDDARVLEELAELAGQERMYDEAIRRWEQVERLSQNDPNKQLAAQVQIGQLLLDRGDRDEAVAAFDAALDRLKPESWEAGDVRRRIERAFLQNNDFQGLVSHIEKRRKRRPEDIDTLLQLANALMMDGQTEQAISRHRDAVKLAPGRRDVREALIDALVRALRLDDAVVEARALVERHPQEVEALARLGQLVMNTASGDGRQSAETEAAEIWSRISRVRPNDPALSLRAAELCRSASSRPSGWSLDLEEASNSADEKELSPLLAAALRQYGQAVQRSDGQPQYYEYLGDFLHWLGRDDEAVDALANVGKSGGAQELRQLAELYSRFGYLSQAIESGEKLIAAAPDDFEAHDLQASLCLKADQYERAIAAAKQLDRLAASPALIERAAHRHADIYITAGRTDRHIGILQAKIDEQAASLLDRWTLSLLLENSNRAAEAAAALKPVAESADADALLIRHYAVALDQAGDKSAAIEQWRRLIELLPHSRADFYERIVRLELELGNYESARQTAETFASVSPGSVAAHLVQADVAFQMKVHEEGIAALRRAVKISPRDFDIRARLASALGKHQRFDEARRQWWRCFELGGSLHEKQTIVGALCEASPNASDRGRLLEELRNRRRRADDPKALTVCLAEALRRFGRPIDAVIEMESLLAAQPRDLDVLSQLVQTAETREKWDEAARHQRQIVALAPDRAALEKLAEFYGLAGEGEKEKSIWRRIVQELNAEAAAKTVDERLCRSSFADAAELAELGLERHPSSWRLLYRAGLAQFLRNRWTYAAEHWEKLASLDEQSAVAVVSNPFVALSSARAAFDQMIEISPRIRFDAQVTQIRRPSMGGAGSNAFAAPLPGDLDQTLLYATIGRYIMAQGQGESYDFMDEELKASRGSIDRLRRLASLCVGVGHARTPDALDQLQTIKDDDPLPRVARLMMPSGWPVVIRGSRERQEWIDALVESQRWLKAQHPRLEREAFPSYFRQMTAFGLGEKASGQLRERIENVAAAGHIAPLFELATESTDPEIHAELLQKAGALSAGGQAGASNSARPLLERMLSFYVSQGKRWLNNDDSADAVVRLFERLVAIAPGAPSAQAPNLQAQARTSSSHLVFARQLQISQQQIARLRAAGAPQAAIDRAVQTYRRLSSMQTPAILQSSKALASGRFQAFPSPNAHLDVDAFVTLQQLTDALMTTRREGLLVERLAARTGEAEPEAKRSYLMAQSCVLWWSDRREESLETLQQLCDSAPSDNALRLSLAFGYNTMENLPAAWEAIKPLLGASGPEGQAAEALRNRILRE